MAASNAINFSPQPVPEQTQEPEKLSSLSREDLEFITELAQEREVDVSGLLEYANIEDEFKSINQDEMARFEAFRPAMFFKEARDSNRKITEAQKGWAVIRAISGYKKQLADEQESKIKAAEVILLRDHVGEVVQ